VAWSNWDRGRGALSEVATVSLPKAVHVSSSARGSSVVDHIYLSIGDVSIITAG
jgi:hypothetical protein